jgi:polyhydroxybutyrate depolymerase
MKSFIKTVGIVIGILIALALILLIIMGFLARRQGMTISEFLSARQEKKRAAESQELTDTSIVLNTGMNSFKITSGGLVRTGYMYIPASYDSSKPTPLVVGYHGGFGQGENQEKLTHMSQVADKENFVLLYPDGVNRHWNDGRAKAASYTTTTDDIQFTKDLLAAAEKRVNIDTKRIYATGISNGGMMTYRVAREMTSTFAAIASVSSAIPEDQKVLQDPSEPIPVLIMQSTDDPLIPFNGGAGAFNTGMMAPTRETIDYWVKINHANSTPLTTQLPDVDPSDGTTITHESYAAQGAGTAPVEYYQVNGGGHTWAGGNQYARERLIGKTSRDVDASALIWEFFKQYSR